MARHFRFGTYLGVNDREIIVGREEGPVDLELGCYYGFMLGPDSDHDIVSIVAGTEHFTLPAGAVIPIEPFQGIPTVQLIRSFDARGATGAVVQSVLHVIGLTKPEELAVKPRRAPIRREYIQSVPAIVRVALGGRRHSLVGFSTAAPGTLVLSGYDVLGGTAELLNVALAAGSTAYNVGGTDHEELWPTLIVNCSVAATILIHSCGENGG
jgi:hypothetical protein